MAENNTHLRYDVMDIFKAESAVKIGPPDIVAALTPWVPRLKRHEHIGASEWAVVEQLINDAFDYAVRKQVASIRCRLGRTR